MPRKPRALFEIDKRSVARLNRQFQMLKKSAHKEISEEMDGIMGDVLKDAKSETPVLTARLKESGRLEKSNQGATKKWEIKFGGISVRGVFVDYALVVHERGKRFLVPAFDKAERATSKNSQKENGFSSPCRQQTTLVANVELLNTTTTPNALALAAVLTAKPARRVVAGWV